MSKLIKRLLKIQIFRFLIIGGLAFVIDYSLLHILTEYFDIYYLTSSVISFTVALIFNYIASIKWVFDVKKKQTILEVILFIELSVMGLGINQIIMEVFVELYGIHYMITKIIATIVVMVWNFITRKIFIEK